MVKEFYKILEVSENATQEEIKKAYRKLAMKWHPDKWINKNLQEKEQANKKMQEINKVFEILGDEEKRKRYDLGENNFTSDSEYGYSYEEELGNISDELERLREEQKFLARKDVINIVGFEMLIKEIYPRQLDSNLWAPYDRWQEKVWKIEIKDDDTNEYGIDTSELDKFKETMINAIRKRKEEWKAGINNPYFDKTKICAIEVIEEAMKEKGLKAEDLGEYSNYKEQINNMDRQWKIHNLEDEILIYISQKGRGHTKKGFDWRQDKQEIGIDKLKKIITQPSSTENNEEWKKEKAALEKQIQDLKSQNNQTELAREVNNLKQLVKQLEKEVNQLKEEVQELKKENDNSPEFNSYLNKKESELQSKQSKLEQLRGVVEIGGSENQKPKSDNDFPIGLVIGGIIFVLLGLLMIGLIISRRNDAEWTKWKQEWESRRSEHEKIKCLTEILQSAISEYKQGIDSREIEEGIKIRMPEWIEEGAEKEEAEDFTVDMQEPIKTAQDNSSSVRLLTNSEDNDILSASSSSWLPSSFRKRTISNPRENKSSLQENHELVDISNQEEKLQTQTQIPPKQN